MTKTITAFGSLLNANLDNRVLSYRLLPFGEEGRTNVGKITASKGRVTLPEDPGTLVANLEHDPTRPLGKFTALTESDDGLDCSVKVLPTTAGDDLLIEAAEGVRTGISVEIDEPVIRDGALLGGTLTGAGFVTKPAFPSAQLVAADAGELPPDFPEWDLPGSTTSTNTSTDEITIDGVKYTITRKTETTSTTEVDAPNAAPAADNGAGTVPDTTTAAAPSPVAAASTIPVVTNRLSAALAAPNADRRSLLASLDQATATDLLPTQAQQWLGEVYGSKTYVRRFSSLVQHGNLSALKALGWKFTTGKTPAVADYSGFPNQPNSNEVATEAVTLDAARLAGAGSVDRAFIDFPSPEFWDAYFREVTNSYERQSDAKIRDAMIAGATDVVAGTVPTGVSTAATYIVDGAMSIIAVERDLPAWAIVGSDLYRDFLLTRSDDMLAFLNSALGLEEGTISTFRVIPSAVSTLTGKVLVGTSTAATQYELPGVPVRVDAVNIAQGGLDRGVFGYHAELINDAESLALVAAAE